MKTRIITTLFTILFCLGLVAGSVYMSGLQDDIAKAKFQIGKQYKFATEHPSYLQVTNSYGTWFLTGENHLSGNFVIVKPRGAKFIGSHLGSGQIDVTWQYDNGSGETWRFYGAICLKDDPTMCLSNSIEVKDIIAIDKEQ